MIIIRFSLTYTMKSLEEPGFPKPALRSSKKLKPAGTRIIGKLNKIIQKGYMGG
jgi:hypothetical protein